MYKGMNPHWTIPSQITVNSRGMDTSAVFTNVFQWRMEKVTSEKSPEYRRGRMWQLLMSLMNFTNLLAGTFTAVEAACVGLGATLMAAGILVQPWPCQWKWFVLIISNITMFIMHEIHELWSFLHTHNNHATLIMLDWQLSNALCNSLCIVEDFFGAYLMDGICIKWYFCGHLCFPGHSQKTA